MGISGAAIAAYASAGAAVVGAATAIESRKDAKAAGRFASEERAAKEAQAAQSASAKIAMQRRALKGNSLATGAGQAAASGAQTTLGV